MQYWGNCLIIHLPLPVSCRKWETRCDTIVCVFLFSLRICFLLSILNIYYDWYAIRRVKGFCCSLILEDLFRVRDMSSINHEWFFFGSRCNQQLAFFYKNIFVMGFSCFLKVCLSIAKRIHRCRIGTEFESISTKCGMTQDIVNITYCC